jgi:putative glutamine amidotransferase
MSPLPADKPRIGIPWRTQAEEQGGVRQKLDYYFAAVRQAGAEAVAISLQQSADALGRELEQIQGFVLPGSPADVDPSRYGAERQPKSNAPDTAREATDNAILKHASQTGKPVLAICFGCQILNVYLGGSLIQDIRSERPAAGVHGTTDLSPGAAKGDLEHMADFEPGSRLARLAGGERWKINSSHHQAIDRPGKGLTVTARSDGDGIVEGVEWTGGPAWVTGVQWHPERMAGDAFAARLFEDFVEAVRQHAAIHAGVRG